MIACRLASEPCIAAQLQPAQVLDYARSREAPESALLRGTGLATAALDGALAPAQYLRLLANTLKALDSPDTSFMLGQQLLPGHDGALSHALLQAPSLRDALETLCAGHGRLTPLLRPRLQTWEEAAGGGAAALVWSDSYGAPALRPALVEMHMTAVVALCRWLGGVRLPWRFTFNRAAPRHVEQHEVHLGSALRFDCHLDAMLIDARWLDEPWPRGSALAAARALATARQEGLGTPGLLAALYDYLLENVRRAPTLEGTAAAFGVSPATFKRQLQRHGTHFQAELDQVRTHVALWLFHARRAGNDAVAQYLGFHDSANFRRSFKRWTGQTPGLLRSGW